MLAVEEAFTMANTTHTPQSSDNGSATQGPRSQTPLTRAWISLALIPVFFFVSFAAAQGIYALTGYDPSTGVTPPLWADLVAGLPALAILLIPCGASVVYGLRAARAGVRAGIVPAVLGVLLGIGAALLTFL
jgi:hypothetical protein